MFLTLYNYEGRTNAERLYRHEVHYRRFICGTRSTRFPYYGADIEEWDPFNGWEKSCPLCK